MFEAILAIVLIGALVYFTSKRNKKNKKTSAMRDPNNNADR